MQQNQSAAEILESLSDDEIRQLPQEDIDFLMQQAESELGASASQASAKPKSILEGAAERIGSAAKSLGTAAESAADTFLFGYLPQLKAGAAISPSGDRFGLPDQPTALEGNTPIQPRPSFAEARDRAAAEMRARQEENPTASAIGTGLGIGASMLLPSMAGARILRGGGAVLGSGTAKAVGRIGGAATEGALSSAIQNPGDIEGKVDPLQIEERTAAFLDTITSPLNLGLASVAGVAPRFSKSKGAEPKAFSKEEQRALSLLEPTPSEAEELILKRSDATQSPKAISKFLKNYRIGQMGDDYEQIYRKSDQVRNRLGKEIEEIYQKNSGKIEQKISEASGNLANPEWIRKNPEVARALTNFNSEDYFNSIVSEFSKANRFSPDAPKAVNELTNYLEMLKTQLSDFDPVFNQRVLKKPDLITLHEIRREIDAKIKDFSNARAAGIIGDQSAQDKAYNFLRSKVNQAIFDELDAIEKIAGRPAGSRLRDLNSQYSTAVTTTDLARSSFGRDISKDARMKNLLSPIADILEPPKGMAESIKNIGTDILGFAKEAGTRGMEQGARISQMINPERNQMANYLKVSPEEVPEYEKIINEDESIGTIDKARRIQLLKKYNLFKPL